jgi:segregation and condensation protein B
MGRKDLPGRPIIYGTTKAFLELFSLNSLSDLPTLKELQPPPVAEEIPKEEILRSEAGGVTADESSTINEAGE